MARTTIFLAPLAAIVLVASPRAALAAPQPDWYTSVLSDRGLEIDADARIFTLFSALNLLGYDVGPLARRDPLPRPALSPIRIQVRTAAPMSPALADRFQAFFDAHPLPLRTYVAYVLSLGPGPDFAAGSASPEGPSLRGFEQLLTQYYKEAHLDSLYAKLQPQYRAVLKAYLGRVDPAFTDADRLLKISAEAENPPPPVIAVNLLDGAGRGYGSRQGATAMLVVGPDASGEHGDLAAALAAYARVRAAPVLGERVASVKGLPEMVQQAKAQGLPDGQLTPAEYLTESFGVAVAATVLPDRRQQIYDEALGEGCWLADDLGRMLQDATKGPRPLGYVAENLGSLRATRGGAHP
jgi:hypothetical protein